MAKYTDEQIKAVLKNCNNSYSCTTCLLHRQEDCGQIHKIALDLINRQEKEIERLKEKNRRANQCTPKAIRRAKSEAIKEFAERLKEKEKVNNLGDGFVYAWEFGKLVKEMVGEGE